MLFGAILLLHVAAMADAQEVAELPQPPDDLIYPTELAERGAKTIIRTRNELAVPDGFSLQHAIRVQVPVRRTVLGEVPIGQRVTIVVDPALSPKLQVVPPQPHVWRGNDFLVLDGESRLLAAATEIRDGSARDPLFGAIGTSRLPSKRYTKRELQWAWWALRNSRESARERLFDLHDLQYDEDLPPVGAIELILRFELHGEKRALLRAIRRRGLSPAEVDLAEIALWDTSPEVQTEAAHLLLDQGRRVDPTPLLATLKNYDNNRERFRVVGHWCGCSTQALNPRCSRFSPTRGTVAETMVGPSGSGSATCRSMTTRTCLHI